MLEIDTTFTLTEADWAFEAPRKKSQAALMGLAIDLHIKRLAEANGCEANPERFGPWDWKLPDGTLIDTKSTTKGSISISDEELMFTDAHIDNGGRLWHAVFEQDNDTEFTFRGFVDVARLLADNRVYNSQYGGYYYTLNNVGKYLF